MRDMEEILGGGLVVVGGAEGGGAKSIEGAGILASFWGGTTGGSQNG